MSRLLAVAKACATPSHEDCDYVVRLKNANATSESNSFGFVSVDPMTGDVWHQELDEPGAPWISEKPSK